SSNAMTLGRFVMQPGQGGVAAAGGGAPPCDPAGVGGEGGIRTRDGLPRTAFPVRRHSPLGDLSSGSIIVRATTFRRMAVPGKAEPSTVASAPKVRERGAQATTR